ncbi:hypothetical protein Tco_0053553 [Tanacetum coccineum]
MALPNEHQLKFNSYKDAKTLMQAIKNRFGVLKRRHKEGQTVIPPTSVEEKAQRRAELKLLRTDLEAYESESTWPPKRIGFDIVQGLECSIATREDIARSAEAQKIKTAETGSLPEGLCQLRKLLQMP